MSLQERVDIPAVPLPTSSFCLASPSLEEVRGVVRKARNLLAPGPNGVHYLLYKRCPKTLYLLHSLIQRAWSSATVDDEWKKAEGVYIPKKKDSKGLNQFRPISLLNVEGKIFFSIMASRLTEFMMSNQYVDIFSQKGRHSRCTRLYRAYLDDLGGYPESQEEPAESVRGVA